MNFDCTFKLSVTLKEKKKKAEKHVAKAKPVELNRYHLEAGNSSVSYSGKQKMDFEIGRANTCPLLFSASFFALFFSPFFFHTLLPPPLIFQ